MMTRFLRFNAVSALGMLVQLGSVSVLVGLLDVHYVTGTALAVEVAVLHNFVWHERWTWGTRSAPRRRLAWLKPRLRTRLTVGAGGGGVAFRCLAFHAGNGSVSLLGTLALLPLLVGTLHLHYLAANLVTIAVTGVLNFLVSDRLVFAH